MIMKTNILILCLANIIVRRQHLSSQQNFPSLPTACHKLGACCVMKLSHTGKVRHIFNLKSCSEESSKTNDPALTDFFSLLSDVNPNQ